MIYTVYSRFGDTYYMKKQFGVWRPRIYATRKAAADFARTVSDDRIRWSALAVDVDEVQHLAPKHGYQSLMTVRRKALRVELGA